MAGYMPKEIKEDKMPKAKGLPEPMLNWRAKQKTGAIMKPATFKKIEAKAEAGGLSPERAKKVAGKAYWKTAKAKYAKNL